MNDTYRDRLRGVAVGAAIGDALGMPLEFGPPRPADRLLRTMEEGRLPAGTFTDDTEMALAVAESLLAYPELNAEDLTSRFVAWYRAGPSDIGIQTGSVLAKIASGVPWHEAVEAIQRKRPESAGNGSVMRCWPVAIAYHNRADRLVAASALQGRITHPHPECVAGCVFINLTISHLVAGAGLKEAVRCSLEQVDMPAPLRTAIDLAPSAHRDALPNSGWVRHTIASAVWGLLTTDSFEEAVVQVTNLGGDADTAGTVAGALAGAAYGLGAIPTTMLEAVHGEWPLRSGTRWDADRLILLADRLAQIGDRSAP